MLSFISWLNKHLSLSRRRGPGPPRLHLRAIISDTVENNYNVPAADFVLLGDSLLKSSNSHDRIHSHLEDFFGLLVIN